ncbi:subtilisin-like serine protease PR1C, partial [Metarhizium majus ARSEF 297]
MAMGHRSYDKEWDGQILSGDYLPPGDYELVVRALRIFGDPTMEADWDAAEPLSFQVTSGAGEEACKAYQSGKGPKDALFRNLQECHQVHNKTAVDAPWMPHPQDSSKCDDDNPTEEDCGTYHYCKAHEERPDDIISPFRHKYECIYSHKLLPTVPFDPLRFSECPKTRDPSICGSIGWCVVIFQIGGPAHEWSSSEECLWAHGII